MCTPLRSSLERSKTLIKLNYYCLSFIFYTLSLPPRAIQRLLAAVRPLRRAQLLPFFSRLDPCPIGMEACSSAHHWARDLTALGHDVRLIPPVYVKPHVNRRKSDVNDAEAIFEAVTRPTMRFIAVKTVPQQSFLSRHRARDLRERQAMPTDFRSASTYCL